MEHETPTKSPPKPQPNPSQAPRNALAAVVGVLLMVLIGGTVVVLKGAFSPQQSNGSTHRAAPSELQLAIDAAAKHMAEQRYGEARTLLERMAEKHPADREVRILLARALVAEQQFEAAYGQFEAAMALADGDAPLHFEVGTVANTAGLVDRAYEHYFRAQTMDPYEPKYPLYLAMIQLKQHDRSAAAASLVRAVTLDEELAEGWGTLAEIYLEEGKLGLAQQNIEKARRLQPESDKWKLAEAKILKRSGKADLAVTLLLSMSEQSRRSRAVLQQMGQCYGLLGQPAEAAARYEEAFGQTQIAEFAYEAALWHQRARDLEGTRRMAKAAQMLGHPDAGDLLK